MFVEQISQRPGCFGPVAFRVSQGQIHIFSFRSDGQKIDVRCGPAAGAVGESQADAFLSHGGGEKGVDPAVVYHRENAGVLECLTAPVPQDGFSGT